MRHRWSYELQIHKYNYKYKLSQHLVRLFKSTNTRTNEIIDSSLQIQSADGVINSHPVFIDAAPGGKTEREYINTNESWGSELRNTEADRNTGREHMNTNDNASVLENWDATTKTRTIKGYIVNVMEGDVKVKRCMEFFLWFCLITRCLTNVYIYKRGMFVALCCKCKIRVVM